MKTIGIVGGLGPESTIDYYRSIISVYRRRVKDGSYPSIIIVSLDVDKALRLVSSNHLEQLTEYLAASIRKLSDAGADFALLSANTPHVVFNQVRRLSPLPLISIVEATCQEVKRRGLKTVSLLGTRFTMSGRFYPEVFEKQDIALAPPSPEEQAYIHDKYVNELVNGVFLPETRTACKRSLPSRSNGTAFKPWSLLEPNCHCSCAPSLLKDYPCSIPLRSMSM